MSWRRWHARLRFGELVAFLALLTALLVLGLSVVIKSFYSHDLKGYEPKDIQRGKQLEQKHGRETAYDPLR